MASERKYIIYGLIDPRDGQLRYVGLHCGSPQKRLNEHLSHARKGKKIYVYDWIRQVLAGGQLPSIEVLEACDTVDEMIDAEQWHIAYWRSLGCRLTNLTSGGEGCFGYKHTSEAKANMSILKKGRKWSASQRQKQQHVTATQQQEIVNRYRAGESCERIASSFDLSSGGIRKVLMRAGVQLRDPWCKTSSHRGPASKLSAEKWIEAIAMYTTGSSADVVGAHFGVSGSALLYQLRKRGITIRTAGRRLGWVSKRSINAY